VHGACCGDTLIRGFSPLGSLSDAETSRQAACEQKP
jgi:hypothetical protein